MCLCSLLALLSAAHKGKHLCITQTLEALDFSACRLRVGHALAAVLSGNPTRK
jgi:hypothetical protein